MSVIKEKFTAEKIRANIEIFDSAFEMADTCKKRTITDSNFHDMRTDKINKSWHGVNNYSEAIGLLENGWQEQMDKVKKDFGTVVQRADGKRISFTNDVVGFSPIVPLALKGVPNCMINQTMKKIKAKVVNIVYDMSASSSTSPQQMSDNLVKLMKIVVSLELKGYRIGLTAMQSYSDRCTGAKHNINSDMAFVKVKTPNQPLDVKRAMFPLGHPAMFRVIGFDWYSKFPKGKHRWGYGTPLGLMTEPARMTEFVKKALGKEYIYISSSVITNSSDKHIEEQITGGKKNEKK